MRFQRGRVAISFGFLPIVTAILCAAILPFAVVPSRAAGQGVLIPVPNHRDFVFDIQRGVLNIGTRSPIIERYDPTSQSLLSPITVPGATRLAGMDISGDRSTIYVGEGFEATAESSGVVYKIDLDSQQVTDLPFQHEVDFELGVDSLKIGANNKLFFTTSFAGSGWVPLREIDTTTDTFSIRSDAPGSGASNRVTRFTNIARSADRTRLSFIEGLTTARPAFTYDATTDTFSDSFTSNSFSYTASAVNRDGSLISFRTPSGQVNYDLDFNVVHTFSFNTGAVGFDPVRDRMYATDLDTDELVFIDTTTGNELNRIAVGEDVTAPRPMTFSDDGDHLFLGTEQGIRMFSLLPELSTLTDPSNASFDVGSNVDNLSIDFGSIVIEDTASPIDFQIANLFASINQPILKLQNITGSGDTSQLTTDLTPFLYLDAGDSRSFTASLDKSALGSFAASYDLNFTDVLGTDQTITLTMSGDVVLPEFASNASFSTDSDQDVLNLDFGTVNLDSTVSPIGFQIANLLAFGTTADLDLVSITGSGDTTILSTDLAPFIDLDGSDFLNYEAMLDTSTPGPFGATYELSFTDILGTDQTITLNLSGEVAIIDDPAIPDLIYDAATGEVVLDPDASSIIGYSLQNDDDGFLPGGFTPVLGGVSTALTSELAEAALSPGSGSIGFVFPAGMDITELFNFLSVNTVSTGLGAPLVPFDLIVIPAPVPEPSTYVMAVFGLLGLGLYGWRRRVAGSRPRESTWDPCPATKAEHNTRCRNTPPAVRHRDFSCSTERPDDG